MGPFALGDLVGLDTLAHVRSDLVAAYGDRFDDAEQIAAQVAAGRLGTKSGAGFYDGAAPEASADDAGRAVAGAYYGAAVDEAERCQAEGIAAEADIDVAMRLGCGWSEGPLTWSRADREAG
jgi:3-hydroxyacyl-CoA dehydrogenase